jgi:DegV family protein with EDD domain
MIKHMNAAMVLSEQTIPMRKIDGRWLYYMFMAGTRKVIAHREMLNRINVFPVKDGDTGANMAFTLGRVVESLQPDRSYKRMLDQMAETALMNARGNSGIIFAQFLLGVSSETPEQQWVSIDHFAVSVKNALRYIYGAVADPVEGTMLTIIRAWSEFIFTHHRGTDDFGRLLVASKPTLNSTLADTPSKLSVLAKAGVVDAGASAFAYFIDGMIECIRSRGIRHLIRSAVHPQDFDTQAADGEVSHSVPERVDFRYCTEAIIRDVSIEFDRLKSILQAYGDSVVVAGTAATGRLHVHTSQPDRLFDALQGVGTITFQKADDMLRQSQAISGRKYGIALVTDSACDLAPEQIDDHQIHMLPINLYFGDRHYLDKITMRPEQFYRRIGRDSTYPTTAQVNEMAFRQLFAHLAAHYDAVISVHLTAKFSGTYFSACKAAEVITRESGTPIAAVDAKTVSGAQGLIVLRIAKAIETGLNFEEIMDWVPRWVGQSRLLVSVKTLKYMVRGGRVSPLKGLVANLVRLNPIITLDRDGNSMLLGKTIGQRSNMKKVMAHIAGSIRDRSIWNYVVLHANNPAGADWYQQQMVALAGMPPAATVNISPVVAASAGLGAGAVAYMLE